MARRGKSRYTDCFGRELQEDVGQEERTRKLKSGCEKTD